MTPDERLFLAVTEALHHNRLTLPTLPEMVMRIGQLAQDPSTTPKRLAVEIGRDPAMTVRMLRVANSSALRGEHRVDSLQQAVMRLGTGVVRSLVSGLALEQLFFSKSPAMRERLRRSWAHSLEVAALAQVLASRSEMLRPELGMLAGLVHEIGTLPIIRVAETLGDDLLDAAGKERAIHNLQRRVGPLILKAWNFPVELVDVPALWIDFSRTHDGPADYIDLVTVAALQSQQHREGNMASIDRTQVPAFAKLGISAEVDVFDLEGVADHYEESYAALAA